MATIAGNATFRVNGTTYSTDGQFTATIQNLKKEVMVGTDGAIHEKETPMASTISGTIFTTADLDVDTVTAMSGVDVQIELNNGKVAVLKDASFTGDASIAVADGTMDIEFSGRGLWA